jgi:hypothetical protein
MRPGRIGKGPCLACLAKLALVVAVLLTVAGKAWNEGRSRSGNG